MVVTRVWRYFRTRRWMVAWLIVVLAIAGSDAAYVHSTNETTAQRRYDNCTQKRDLYDGEITTVVFIGEQLHATDEQIAAGLVALKKKIHDRPECGEAP